MEENSPFPQKARCWLGDATTHPCLSYETAVDPLALQSQSLGYGCNVILPLKEQRYLYRYHRLSTMRFCNLSERAQDKTKRNSKTVHAQAMCYIQNSRFFFLKTELRRFPEVYSIYFIYMPPYKPWGPLKVGHNTSRWFVLRRAHNLK